MAGTLGGAKTTIWYILKRKECTGKLSNTKRAGRPQKLTKVDDGRILSLVKKTLHNINPGQENSPGGSCIIVKV